MGDLLKAKKCFDGTDSMTVSVDLASLAAVTAEAETHRSLKAALQASKIVMHGPAVSVVMTYQSWNAVTHNISLDPTAEALERIQDQQEGLEGRLNSLTSLVAACYTRLNESNNRLSNAGESSNTMASDAHN